MRHRCGPGGLARGIRTPTLGPGRITDPRAVPSAVRGDDRRRAELDQPVSPGELKVLRYLPTTLSLPEIAGELSVSTNTVNTHLRSIYAKLQVRDRSSAVRRARELRLLSAGRMR
jgi:ATP/maltotriose-dependent transcriptional regulator MalT